MSCDTLDQESSIILANDPRVLSAFKALSDFSDNKAPDVLLDFCGFAFELDCGTENTFEFLEFRVNRTVCDDIRRHRSHFLPAVDVDAVLDVALYPSVHQRTTEHTRSSSFISSVHHRDFYPRYTMVFIKGFLKAVSTIINIDCWFTTVSSDSRFNAVFYSEDHLEAPVRAVKDASWQ